jgi:uncharacterized membrane protein
MNTIFVIPDVYHLIASFVIYSILGWLVESIYMSICNKKLTNRGFMFLPFCPIYGFGATIGCILLSPLVGNVILLYVVSAVVATIFEYLVAKLMIGLFGKLWWDYNEKPLNYKGIICLESTLAWGLYGIGIVKFLNVKVIGLIDTVKVPSGILALKIIFAILAVDFIYHFLIAVGIDMGEKRKEIKEMYQNFRFR